MAARGPRIGRPDRIAALVAELEAEDALGFPGQPALTRLLMAPTPAESQARTRQAIRESAQQLAEALRPLPAALGEITTRINRHCANTGRDAELARAVEAVRDRTFALWMATGALAKAAEGRA
jgi:hypothetical protein